MSFGLMALFISVTAAAVVAGAARMTLSVGALFATDALVLAVGVHYVHSSWLLYRAAQLRRHDRLLAGAQLRFGLLLVVFALATFGAAAIAQR
jgi:hypothetical protein